MATIVLEEAFYPGEAGFSFSIKTGIDMSNLLDGEVKGVIRRPNKSLVSRTIPIAQISDKPTGTVFFEIVATDFTMPGTYTMQIQVKDADTSLTRPSHPISFEVEANLADAADVFV